MISLIAAESAIFTIFVVAYIFYIGKSLSGPTPKDVLEVPVFATICLLSSSLTIHLAVRALKNAKVAVFGVVVVRDIGARRDLSDWNGPRVAPPDL